jgi:hypothetical protein
MTHTTVPQTIPEFVDACRTLSNEDIYVLFEETIPQSLRDAIYALSTDPEEPEPVRDALELLGLQYNVQSLIDY